jgi:acyl-coenzyme A synthetase/AMP-(fatty) acid ligase
MLFNVDSGLRQVVECAVVGTKDEIKGVVPIALLVCTASGNAEPGVWFASGV